MKFDDIEHEFVTQDDGPGQTEVFIMPINDDWGRIILSCNIKGKIYRLGVLAPRTKDIEPFIAGAKLAGWTIEDKRE